MPGPQKITAVKIEVQTISTLPQTDDFVPFLITSQIKNAPPVTQKVQLSSEL
jgi:hypothetical protein